MMRSLGMPQSSHYAAAAAYSAAMAAAAARYPYPGLFPPMMPHPMMPASTAAQHTCNWVAGADFCGKRFSTGEELMQHLRTHTSAASSPVAASSAMPSAADMGLAALQSAQAALLMGLPPASVPTTTSGALAALQAQAARSVAAVDHRFHPYGRPSTSAYPAPHMLPYGLPFATPPSLLYP
jgi:hypothetical protein